MIVDRYQQVTNSRVVVAPDCLHAEIVVIVDGPFQMIECVTCKERWKPLLTDGDAARILRGKHCDAYIQDFAAPRCLRFFLLVQRMPALDAMLCRSVGVVPKLFATYEGTRVRVVMASRIGDVGITTHLDAEDGYQKRVMVGDLTNFGETP